MNFSLITSHITFTTTGLTGTNTVKGTGAG